jgi:hypothetical protein
MRTLSTFCPSFAASIIGVHGNEETAFGIDDSVRACLAGEAAENLGMN